jgi:hypothetical protein
MFKEFFSNQFYLLKYLVRWSVIVIPVAIAIGSMVALFLCLLGWAIHFRFGHTWLLYLLPLAGVVIHLLYTNGTANLPNGAITLLSTRSINPARVCLNGWHRLFWLLL